MNFYVDSGGVILAVDPERVFQGSAMANTIRFIGAFPSNASVTVTYILPDGTQMQPQLMTFNKELSGVISAEKGVTLSIWEQNIGVRFETQAGGGVQAVPDYTVLSQVGKVGVVFTVSQANASGVAVTQATARSSFICEKGKSLSMPSEAFDDYESLLNQILAQLSNVLQLAEDVEYELEQVKDKKVNRSGDTMTGPLEVIDEENTSIKTFYASDGAEVINQSDRGKTRYGYGGVMFDNGSVETEFLFPEDEEETATIATQEHVAKEIDSAVDELRANIDSISDEALQKSQVGQPNGVAPLDDGAKIPSEYLPSYVDDVIEFSVFVYGADWLERTLEKPIGTLVFCSADAEDLDGGEESPYYQKFLLNTDGTQEGLQIIAPEKGKIYVNTYSGKIYRWSGSGLFEISDLLKLGETSNTAYPGDKGKANADAIAELQEFLNDVPELNSTATPFLISKKDETGARRATIVLGEEYTDKTTGKVSYEAGIQSELVDIKAYEIDESGNKTTKAGVSVKNDGTVRIKGELCDANGNPINAQIYEDLSQLKELLDLAELTEVVETTSTYDTRETAGGLTLVPNAPTTVKKVVGNTVSCKQLFDISKLDATSKISKTDRDIIVINGYSVSSDKTVKELFPNIKAGITYTAACTIEMNATVYAINGEVNVLNSTRIIPSGKVGYVKNTVVFKEDDLDKTVYFYGFADSVTGITNSTVKWKNLILVEGDYTNTEMPAWQPYFTGLKSASFAGVESTNADGTETSTLAFPKTEMPLGKTIDFENKKIVEAYAQYTFTGQETVNANGAYGSDGYYRYIIRPNGQTMKTGTAQDGICDKFPTDKRGWLSPLSECIRFGQSNGAIYLILKNDLTVEEVQALIAGMTVRYPIETPIETPFTEAQEAARNTYTPYTGGTETQLNDNAKFGANNTVTQDYDIVNKIGG